MKYGIMEIAGGIGKNIMATAVIKNIKLAHPDLNILVVTGYPEVFVNNPEVYRVFKFGGCPYFYNDYVKNNDCIFFCDEPYRANTYLLQTKHLIESWCEAVHVPCVTKQTSVVLNPREIENMKIRLYPIQQQKKVLIFQPFGGASDSPYSWNRDIPPQQAQDMANILSQKYHIFQPFQRNQIKLQNCEPIAWPLRDLFAVSMLANGILAIDSCIQHFAAAVNKAATVCWVTNKPEVFGYPIHRNVMPLPDQYIINTNNSADAYFMDYDFTGSRLYDYPFKGSEIFNLPAIVETLM